MTSWATQTKDRSCSGASITTTSTRATLRLKATRRIRRATRPHTHRGSSKGPGMHNVADEAAVAVLVLGVAEIGVAPPR